MVVQGVPPPPGHQPVAGVERACPCPQVRVDFGLVKTCSEAAIFWLYLFRRESFCRGKAVRMNAHVGME